MADSRADFESRVRTLNTEINALTVSVEATKDKLLALQLAALRSTPSNSGNPNSLNEIISKVAAIKIRDAFVIDPSKDFAADGSLTQGLISRWNAYDASKIQDEITAAKTVLGEADAIIAASEKIETEKANDARLLNEFQVRYEPLAKKADELLKIEDEDNEDLEDYQRDLKVTNEKLKLLVDGILENRNNILNNEDHRKELIDEKLPAAKQLLEELQEHIKEVEKAVAEIEKNAAEEKEAKETAIAALKMKVQGAIQTAATILTNLEETGNKDALKNINNLFVKADDELTKLTSLQTRLFEGTDPEVNKLTAAEIKDTLNTSAEQAITAVKNATEAAIQSYNTEFARLDPAAAAKAERDKLAQILREANDRLTELENIRATLVSSHPELKTLFERLQAADTKKHEYIVDNRFGDLNENSEIVKFSAMKNQVYELHHEVMLELRTLENAIDTKRKTIVKEQFGIIQSIFNKRNTLYNNPPYDQNIMRGLAIATQDTVDELEKQIAPRIQLTPLQELTPAFIKANVTDKVDALDTMITNIIDEYNKQKAAADAAAKASTSLKKEISDLIDINDAKINAAIKLEDALDAELKNIDPTITALITQEINDVKTAIKALKDAQAVIHAPIAPLTMAQAKKVIDSEKINDKVKELTDAIDTARTAYKDVVALDDRKKALKQSISDVLNDPRLAAINNKVTKDTGLQAKHPNIKTHDDMLRLPGNMFAAIDNQHSKTNLDAVESQVNISIGLYKDAIEKAEVDAFRDRAEAIHKKFASHQEFITRIKHFVDLVLTRGISKADASQFAGRLKEVNDLINDMELYKKWCKEQNKANSLKSATECLAQLNHIADILKNPGDKSKAGMEHSGEYSEAFIINLASAKPGITKTEEEITKEVNAKIEDLLTKAGYPSAAKAIKSSAGHLSSAPGLLQTDRNTAGFYGVKLNKKRLKGRNIVYAIETGPKKTDHTVAVVTQIQRAGAVESKVKLAQYTPSREEFNFEYSVFIPNEKDRMLATKIVTDHVMLDIKTQIMKKLAADPKAEENAAKILENLAQGKDSPEFRAMNIKPNIVYINGSFRDNEARAIMHACAYLKVECKDTRNGDDCKIIKKLDAINVAACNKEINNDLKLYFKDGIVPAIFGSASATAKPREEIPALRSPRF